jgi:invasion protein IalB
MFKGWRDFRLHTAGAARLTRTMALVACAVMGMAQAQTPAPTAPAAGATPGTPAQATLPSGANAMQETFGDWRITCVPDGNARRCSLIQEQISAQTRQLVLGMQLAYSPEKLDGFLLLPFGILFDRGATLQIDEQAAMPTLRFRTCVPAGCIVPTSFDAKTRTAMRSGASLKIKVTGEDGKEQTLAISLKGFGPALDRIAAVLKG